MAATTNTVLLVDQPNPNVQMSGMTMSQPAYNSGYGNNQGNFSVNASVSG